MIKAMLIVASMGINTEMPSMTSCLEARLAIASQDASIKSLCVPKENETDKMKEMLGVFINMIKKIKELENADGRNIIENR
tara:strand:+ start:18 stop:260 length:243 start_codon:yes stop_codon:yes gene_type:complete